MTLALSDLAKLAPNDLEAAIAATCVVAGIAFPRAGKSLFRWIGARLRPLEKKPRLTFAVIVLLPVLLRFALLPWDPPPLARTMEEHNHLLQAETYERGRVANATHPLAVLFNEFQIVEWPKRVSARPPACPIFFWFGDVVFHSPWLGNVASVALAAGLIYWMLLGWTRPKWAVLIGLLVVFRYCVFGYWTDSFWGASVPLIGGILVLGVAPRVRKKAQIWHAVVLALGVALLLGSRPFEGAVLLMPVGLYLLAWLWRGRESSEFQWNMKRFVVPVAAAGVLILVAQLRYDQVTTGRADLMPYQVWRKAQTTVPAFIWQPLSHQRLIFYYPQARLFQEWEEMVSHRLESPGQAFIGFASRHVMTLREVVGPMMLLPFLCWSAVWFRRRPGWKTLAALGAFTVIAELGFALSEHRPWGPKMLIPVAVVAGFSLLMRWRSLEASLPVACVLVGALATSVSSFYMTNYLLPFVCAFIVVLAMGVRGLSLWDRRRGTGASVVGFLLAGSVVMFGAEASTHIAGHPLYDRIDLGRYDFPPYTGFLEANEFLNKLPGKHLVFVKYGNNYLSTNEFVWNGPDIDSQKIVWARDLRPDWTAAAVQYYKGRQVWFLDKPDERGPVFERYPVEKLPPPAPLSSMPMPYREQMASK